MLNNNFYFYEPGARGEFLNAVLTDKLHMFAPCNTDLDPSHLTTVDSNALTLINPEILRKTDILQGILEESQSGKYYKSFVILVKNEWVFVKFRMQKVVFEYDFFKIKPQNNTFEMAIQNKKLRLEIVKKIYFEIFNAIENQKFSVAKTKNLGFDYTVYFEDLYNIDKVVDLYEKFHNKNITEEHRRLIETHILKDLNENHFYSNFCSSDMQKTMIKMQQHIDQHGQFLEPWFKFID